MQGTVEIARSSAPRGVITERPSGMRAALGTAAAAVAVLLARAASAEEPAAPTVSITAEEPPAEIVVTARRLNAAREQISTQTGASTFTIDSAALEAVPGGENALLSQVILRAPGVSQDSFGQLHVRGEHNGLQYRLNGVILPEGISVFGQTLDPHLIDSMKLITGALPAQYGLRTGGIVDLTTKSGVLAPHGSVSLYGGSHGQFEPSFFHGGASGALTYFVSGDYLGSDLGIEAPDRSITPLHDRTRQYHAYGYFEYLLGPQDRLSWIVGTSHARFEIPDQRGLTPQLGLSVEGITDYASEDLRERQTEITHFGVVSLQHSGEGFDVQSSVTARYSSLSYFPDALGELLFNGIAQSAFKRNVSLGSQTDAAWHLDSHVLRAGIYLQRDGSNSRSDSSVLPLLQTSPPVYAQVPVAIPQSSDQVQWIRSGYLQDEWSLAAPLTLNYGLRFDDYSAATRGSHFSPRINAVWKARQGLTVHGGYARYFSPPPFELVGSGQLGLFAGTSAAPQVARADEPQAEVANYYDLGLEQQFAGGFTVGLDGYYKQSSHLLDEGQFGAPIILTPFNYRHGVQYGTELSASYTASGFSAYLNFAAQRARGKLIESGQFNFGIAELDWIAAHYIPLDHEQRYTASTGVSWQKGPLRLSGDVLLGSGLRSQLVLPGGLVVPNGAHLPYYRQANLGATWALEALASRGAREVPTLRFDVINAFDTVYQIRNGTGVGVGAPQYGPRRGYFAGISIPF